MPNNENHPPSKKQKIIQAKVVHNQDQLPAKNKKLLKQKFYIIKINLILINKKMFLNVVVVKIIKHPSFYL